MTDRKIHEGNFMGTDVRHLTNAEKLEARLNRISTGDDSKTIGGHSKMTTKAQAALDLMEKYLNDDCWQLSSYETECFRSGYKRCLADVLEWSEKNSEAMRLDGNWHRVYYVEAIDIDDLKKFAGGGDVSE